MILVESSVGSRELLSRIRAYGADADLCPHIKADFQFTGNGQDGPLLCGVERKAIQDLLNSMRDKRLAGSQIGPMLMTYDVRYMVVEGLWRRGRDTGLLEVRNGTWHTARGNFRYSEVARFLASLRELADIRVWRTADAEETAAWLAEEWHWWQKEWTEHRTDKTLYMPEPGERRHSTRARMFRHDVSLCEYWIARLPHVDSRARDLAKYFVSARDMADASEERWMAIQGQRIGRKTAKDIVDAVNREV